MKTKVFFLTLTFMLVTVSTATSQTLRDQSGVKIGEISSSGTVRNGSGVKVGEISSSGTVRNGSGLYIGKANVSDKQKVAIVYFFFLLNKR